MAKGKVPEPPKTYQAFVKRFPKIGKAWESIGHAGDEGPLDQKTVRLIKLAISIGALREGAVHSATRKAVAAGASTEEIDQVTALAASTIGFPSTVAVFSWIRDTLEVPKK